MACDALTTTSNGKALVVTNDENCLTELVQEDGGLYPALAISLTDGNTVLRDGSSNQPIELPNLLNYIAYTFEKILAMDSSGRWHAITPSESCIDKKLLVRNGVFVIEPDILPSVIDANICETTDCESVDYLVGLREIDLSDCVEGEYFELVKIPKALWPVCQAEE